MEQHQIDKFAAKIAASEGKEALRARMDDDGLVIVFTDGSKKRYGHGVFAQFAHEIRADAPQKTTAATPPSAARPAHPAEPERAVPVPAPKPVARKKK